MKKVLGLALAATIGLSVLANAQTNGTLGGETSSPVPEGSTVFLRIEANTPMQLRSACVTDVRVGSPTGTIVYQPRFCILLLVIVGPGGPYNNMGWPGVDLNNNPAGPGTYYLSFAGRNVNTSNPLSTRVVPVRFDPAAGPTLPVLKTGAATRGSNLAIGLRETDPLNASVPYGMAASLTTEVGQTYAFGQIDLDLDPLFFLTVGQNIPGLTTGFNGNLVGGNASASLFIPNVAGLQGAQVAVQAVVLGTSGPRISNSNQKVIG